MGEKGKPEEKEKAKEIPTAVYKLNLHCNECARMVERAIIRISGVHKVDTNVDGGKVTVKGEFDVKKMQELIEKKAKRKVELVSVTPKPKEKEEKKETKEKKEVAPKTVVVKVHLHCENCEYEVKEKLIRFKGVHSVKTNREAETVTVVGIVEEKKLVEYIRKKVRKHAEIVPPKKEKEKEKESKEEKAEDKKELKKVETKEEKKEEVKAKEIVVPYFIHCTHPPDFFSDENPNACFVM